MTQLREAYFRLGLPDAISWPGFWVSLIAGALANIATSMTPVPFWVRIFIIAAGQIALWIPPVIARYVLLGDPTRSRPLVVLGSFLLGLALRALVIGLISSILIAPGETLWLTRFVGAVLNIGWLLVLVAYVTSTARERRRQIAELSNARIGLEMAIAQTSEVLTQRNEETVARVREILLSELARMDSSNAHSSLESLQNTVSSVVRPLSHELASAFPAAEISTPLAPIERSSWTEVLDTCAKGRPFRPWMTGCAIGFVLVAATIAVPQLAIWFIIIVFAVVGSLALTNEALQRLLRGQSSAVRIAFVVTGAVVSALVTSGIGLVALWLLSQMRGTIVSQQRFVTGISIGLIVYVVVFSLAIAVITAFGRDRRAVIDELESATREFERSLVLMRQTQWLQQKTLSRALHGPVQMAVTAAAFRLESDMRQGDVSQHELETVRTNLIAELDVLNHENTLITTFDETLVRLRAAWEGICRIDADVAENAARILQDDVPLRSCLIDIVTEAVSNAARHSHATDIDVRVRLGTTEERVLIVSVANNGGLRESGRDESGSRGLGTRLLDECTLAWERVITPFGQELIARLPLHPAAPSPDSVPD